METGIGQVAPLFEILYNHKSDEPWDSTNVKSLESLRALPEVIYRAFYRHR